MHVTFFHDGVVPPPKYGGTERVVYWLAKALHELNHTVTLLAKRGSRLDFGETIELDDPADWTKHVPAGTDILHLWNTPTVTPPKPFLVTIEGNGKPGENFHPNTVFVSQKHAALHGSSHFVYNGLDPRDYAHSQHKEDFAVFLAKAAWSVKNLDGAIDVARRAGLRLEVMGSREWPLGAQRYIPAIRGVKYHGMVDDAFKREILPRARALIFPVRWHEPFGIAVTEALVSGCFVLGTPYGSLPELITPDVGVVSASAGELAEALRNPQRFSSSACRQRVLEGGLTHLDMAKKYLHYYTNVLGEGNLEGVRGAPAVVPSLRSGEWDGKSLLEWRT